MKSVNCAICNRVLVDPKRIAVGVGTDCEKKDLTKLNMDQRYNFKKGLNSRIRGDYSAFSIRVKADYIEISTEVGARATVELSGLSPLEVEQALKDKLDLMIEGEFFEQVQEIKTMAHDILDKKMADLGMTTDGRTEEDMMRNASPTMQKLYKKMQEFESKRGK